MIDPDARQEIIEIIDHINECSAKTDTSFGALLWLLVNKGVFTLEEYQQARLECIAPVEQLRAANTEKARAERFDSVLGQRDI
jgi:hypothetical protein